MIKLAKIFEKVCEFKLLLIYRYCNKPKLWFKAQQKESQKSFHKIDTSLLWDPGDLEPVLHGGDTGDLCFKSSFLLF